MPVYNFKCPDCELKFEKVYKIEQEHKTNCPRCRVLCVKTPPKNVSGQIKEGAKITKEIDLKVGADAEKRWMEYDQKNQEKEKIRKNTNSQRLSKTPDGDYTPLTVFKDGEVVSEKEAVELRKESYNQYGEIFHDPTTEKFEKDDGE